jgi:hypothetical protein
VRNWSVRSALFSPTSFAPPVRPTWVTPADPSVLQARLSLRRADGSVVERARLCWSGPASSATVLGELAAVALRVGRRGLVVHLDDAPDDVIALLAICGLTGPAGPILVGAASTVGSGGQQLRQVELPEQ